MKTARMLTIVAVGLVVAVQASGATWYVDANGSGDFTTIQAALDDPCTVDGDEIEVAPGTYYEAIDFEGEGVRLYSSGGAEVTTIDGSGNDHVVKCVSGEDANTILEGFTITGGVADGAPWPDYHGAGMVNNGSSPTVTNCIFTWNWATEGGGGMLNNWSYPTVTNCTFSYNAAGTNGGGIYNYESSPTVVNCTFSDNSAQWGGGMCNQESSPSVVNCTFSGNSATINAGGLYNINSSPTVTNCTFSGNSATSSGAGIRNYLFSSPTVTNCILWGNSPDQMDDDLGSSAAVTYSDVQGGWSGTGNIDADPLFVDAVGGDLRLRPCSPCVDAGDNNSVPADSSDLDGDGNTVEPIPFDVRGWGWARFVDDMGVADTGAGTAPIVDMGAYERQKGTAEMPVYNVTLNAYYCSIQGAIDDACDSDVIEVAPGTYYEAINFNGKAITLRSSDPNDVNIVAATVIDGTGYYHVVKCVSGEGADTALEGFTITGGNANGSSWPENRGGGMLNDGSSPTLTKCIFSGNWADVSGGGVDNYESSPTVTNCTFIYNTAQWGGGLYNYQSSPTVTHCDFGGNTALYGGGMCNEQSTDPNISDCIFMDNSACINGAGMCNDNSSPTVTACTFGGNWTFYEEGGGMSNVSASPTVTNCTFIYNTAPWGGGLYNYNSSNPTVSNCTFTENSAYEYGGGGIFNETSSPTVTNCILWGNSPDQMVDYPSSTGAVTYSDVEGGYSGTGNIDAYPLFVDAGGGDLRLGSCSPCVDAGDNNSVPADIADLDGDGNTVEPLPFDLGGEPRFVDDNAIVDTGAGMAPIVDMGAYERQSDSVALGTINVPGDFSSIQRAIAEAYPGDEIVVAPGTYYEAINFGGKRVRLYSSGGAEVTTIDASGADHAVKCVSGEDANTILEGFTITGGYADGGTWPDMHGAGMVNDGSSPTVTNCIFSGNITVGNGGGIYNYQSSPMVTNCTFIDNLGEVWGGGMANLDSSSPTVTNCRFINNFASLGGGMYNDKGCPTVTDCNFSGNSTVGNGGGMANNLSDPNVANCIFRNNQAYMYGGGMYNDKGCPTVTNCNFSGNLANNYGAGMYNETSSPTVTNCNFGGNVAYYYGGGGIFNETSSPTVTNCTFINNPAQWGGGLYNYDNSNPTVSNCTFTENTATYSGAGIMNNLSSTPTVTNCIVWGNSPDQIDDYDSPSSWAAATYSDVQGGYTGTGNIDADPCFVTGALGDYYLSQVAAGQAVSSPCVDAGSDTAVNLGLDVFTTRTDQVEDAGIVDMGYHYRLPEPWDLNGDWKVDFIDFGILAEQWQQAPGVPSADIVPPEGDGIVDWLDLGLLVDYWLWEE